MTDGVVSVPSPLWRPAASLLCVSLQPGDFCLVDLDQGRERLLKLILALENFIDHLFVLLLFFVLAYSSHNAASFSMFVCE